MQFAHTTLTEPARKFVEAVLALKPRQAVFDCDGTLWSGDAGADFFFYEIERGLIPPEAARQILARYEQYKAGAVDELSICGEMVTIHQGVAEKEIRALAAELFRTVIKPRVFPELRELEMSDPLTYAAGDVTVHTHLTIHGAGANLTDKPRWAYLILTQPADVCWNGAPPEAFDTTGMTVNQALDDERFPLIG